MNKGTVAEKFIQQRSRRILTCLTYLATKRKEYVNNLVRDANTSEEKAASAKIRKVMDKFEQELDCFRETFQKMYDIKDMTLDPIAYNDSFAIVDREVEKKFQSLFDKVLGEVEITVKDFQRKDSKPGLKYKLCIVYNLKQICTTIETNSKRPSAIIRLRLNPYEKMIIKLLCDDDGVQSRSGRPAGVCEVFSICPFNLLCANESVQCQRIYGFDWRYVQPKLLTLNISWWPTNECWEFARAINPVPEGAEVLEEKSGEKPDELDYPNESVPPPMKKKSHPEPKAKPKTKDSTSSADTEKAKPKKVEHKAKPKETKKKIEVKKVKKTVEEAALEDNMSLGVSKAKKKPKERDRVKTKEKEKEKEKVHAKVKAKVKAQENKFLDENMSVGASKKFEKKAKEKAKKAKEKEKEERKKEKHAPKDVDYADQNMSVVKEKKKRPKSKKKKK